MPLGGGVGEGGGKFGNLKCGNWKLEIEEGVVEISDFELGIGKGFR